MDTSPRRLLSALPGGVEPVLAALVGDCRERTRNGRAGCDGRYAVDVRKMNEDVEVGRGNKIPLWMFGFLY